MPLDCIPISQLTPASGLCKIKVRIVRMWGFPKKDKPEEFAAMDLLLVDEKGDMIQAIKPNLLSRFKEKLEEDSCCVLMNFELGPNLGQFRSSSHPYKINFIFYTCVKHCEKIPNSEVRFNFCPFPEIIAKANDDNVFVDIIGEIVAMNEIKNVTTVDGPTKLLNLQLRDFGDTLIDVALWGKIGETVYSDVKSQTSGPVIFLGSLMKTLLYKGKGTVQSSKFATKVFINSSQPEIISFQEVLSKEVPDTSLAIIPIQSSKSIQISKDLFSFSDRKTISELTGMNQGTSCNILASIVSVGLGNSWFFIGCSICYKTVAPYFNPITEEIEADKYSCEKCNKQITTTQTRFKLKFQAMDHTASASFISFDDVVIPLIKKSAYELLEQQVQFNRSGQTPPELLDLNGRKYVFKILVTNAETYTQSPTYRVLSLTDDPDIIQSFSACASTKNASQPDTVTVSVTSSGTRTQTGNMSSEIEYLGSNASDICMPTPTSKRSLRSSQDEVVQHSSTKPKLMSKTQVKKEKK